MLLLSNQLLIVIHFYHNCHKYQSRFEPSSGTVVHVLCLCFAALFTSCSCYQTDVVSVLQWDMFPFTLRHLSSNSFKAVIFCGLPSKCYLMISMSHTLLQMIMVIENISIVTGTVSQKENTVCLNINSVLILIYILAITYECTFLLLSVLDET